MEFRRQKHRLWCREVGSSPAFTRADPADRGRCQAEPEFRRLATTVDHWWPEIAALIDTGDSNAKSEGINRVITLIARDAFGFRNPPTNAHAAPHPPSPRTRPRLVVSCCTR
ncbi:transposase [Streptomyces bobili]|uniref:transposase n=1 Tax=Streptomyces bobili TaxID=67280 RepID=UPI0036675AB6